MNRILSITLPLLLLFFACKKQQQPPSAATPVNLYEVKARNIVYYNRYTSTTTALNQVNLLPQVQGYITGIFFKEGTHVRKGQKLYEIDQRIYTNNYEAALANLQVADGNLKQAQQDADRYAYLNSKNAVAKQVYDHAIIALENAKNQYKSAEQSVKSSKTSLAYSVIKAPFDGTIGFSLVKMGDLMNVGQTVLNTISADDPMGVDFLINEKELALFKNLENKAKSNHDSLFTLILPDNSLYPYPGKISVIDRAVNPQTGSIRVRLVFPNPKNDLRAGMSCVVRVRNQDSTPQIVIPNRAVIEQMGEYFVFVAKDTMIADSTQTKAKKQAAEKKKGLFALERKVSTGEVLGPNVVIKDGLDTGDKIVIDGIQSIHDGSEITLSNKRPVQSGRGGGKGGI